MPFEAKFAGRCLDCGEGILAGQQIHRVKDADDYNIGFAHEVCDGPAEAGLRRGEIVCPSCFMVKAVDGSCDCGAS